MNRSRGDKVSLFPIGLDRACNLGGPIKDGCRAIDWAYYYGIRGDPAK